MSLDEWTGTSPESPIAYNFKKPWGVRGRLAPLSFIFYERVQDVIIALVNFHIAHGRILDPTCSDDDYQFAHKWWTGQKFYQVVESDMRRTRITDVQASVFALPYNSGSFNGVVYDPPFLSYVSEGKGDPRAELYGQMPELTQEAVFSLYGQTVYDEFARVLVRGGILIVRGQDTYSPKGSDTLLPFMEFAEGYREHFVCVGLYVFRGSNPNLNGMRRLMRKPVANFSYFLTLRKFI
jgi:hypothetical protein